MSAANWWTFANRACVSLFFVFGIQGAFHYLGEPMAPLGVVLASVVVLWIGHWVVIRFDRNLWRTQYSGK